MKMTLSVEVKKIILSQLSYVQIYPWDSEADVKYNINKLFTNVKLVQKYKGRVTKKAIQAFPDIMQVFGSDQTSSRVILEGPSGVGKTSIGKKLANAWACGELKGYEQFLVLPLELRKVKKDQTFGEAVLDQLVSRDKTLSAESVTKCIRYFAKYILVILDGWDEYDQETSKDITDVVNCKLLTDVKTLITSSTWGLKDSHPSWVRLINNGFSKSNAISYMHKILLEEREQDETSMKEDIFVLTTYLDKHNLWHLANNPFICTLLCMVCVNRSPCMPEKMTELYDVIMRRLFTRILSRALGRPATEMEVNDFLLKIKEDLNGVEQLAFDVLSSSEEGDQIVIGALEASEYIKGDVMFQAGLLNKTTIQKNLPRSRSSTEAGTARIYFPNQCMQQYMAARYIASIFLSEGGIEKVPEVMKKAVRNFKNFVLFGNFLHDMAQSAAICVRQIHMEACIQECFQHSDENIIQKLSILSDFEAAYMKGDKEYTETGLQILTVNDENDLSQVETLKHLKQFYEQLMGIVVSDSYQRPVSQTVEETIAFYNREARAYQEQSQEITCSSNMMKSDSNLKTIKSSDDTAAKQPLSSKDVSVNPNMEDSSKCMAQYPLKAFVAPLFLLESKTLADAMTVWTRLQVLILHGNNFHNSKMVGLEDVMTNISYCPELRYLDLHRCLLSDQGMNALAKSISNNKSLQTIIIAHNPANGEGFENLMTAVGSCSSITKLDISYCNSNNEALSALASSIKQLPCIIDLILAGNKNANAGFHDIFQSLSNAPTLKKLDCGGCDLNNRPLVALAKVLSGLKQLTCLNLSGNGYSDQNMFHIMTSLQNCPDLEELAFLDCMLTNDTLKALGESFAKLGKLKKLVLAKNRYSNEGFSEVFEKLVNCALLETLDCSYCTLEKKTLRNLATSISKLGQLRVLNLHGCCSSESSLGDLLTSLVSCSKLESIDLGNNDFSNATVNLLCQCLSRMSNLMDITLSGICSKKFELFKVMDSLEYCPNLKRLDFSDCILSSKTLSALANSIVTMDCLEELDIHGSMVSRDGCLYQVVDALGHCCLLRKLNFSECLMNSKTLKALAKTIPKLDNLEDLCLGDNGTDEDLCSPMSALFHCSKLHVFDCTGCQMDNKTISVLSDSLEQIENLQKFRVNGQCVTTKVVSALGKHPMLTEVDMRVGTAYDDHCISAEGSLGVATNSSSKLNQTSERVTLPFHHWAHLTTLNLNGNTNTDLNKLNCCHQLENLDLSNCGLNGEDSRCLADVLKNLLHLKQLDLSGNPNACFLDIMKSLVYCTHLTRLNVSYCRLKDGVVRALSCSLKQLQHLEYLNLAGNSQAHTGFKPLIEALSSCPLLNVLNLTNCNLCKHMMESLAQVLNHQFLKALLLSNNRDQYTHDPCNLIVQGTNHEGSSDISTSNPSTTMPVNPNNDDNKLIPTHSERNIEQSFTYDPEENTLEHSVSDPIAGPNTHSDELSNSSALMSSVPQDSHHVSSLAIQNSCQVDDTPRQHDEHSDYCRTLIEALRNCPRLTHLDFSRCGLWSTTFSALGSVLAELKFIRHLDLEGNSEIRFALPDLIKGFEACLPHLTMLNLCACGLRKQERADVLAVVPKAMLDDHYTIGQGLRRPVFRFLSTRSNMAIQPNLRHSRLLYESQDYHEVDYE